MLTNGTISALDFINRIRHKDDNLCANLSSFENVDAVTADDERELTEEIQAELSLDIPIVEPSTNPHDESSLLEELDDIEETKEGACITCQSNIACVVFCDCVSCTSCYDIHEKTHIENCNVWYRDDPRKLRRKIKERKCPICGAIASNVIKIRSNSFN